MAMGRPNRGKDFETAIRECFETISSVSIDRLPDPMSGYSGVRNICDFHVFQAPHDFYIECKCLYGNTLNYKSAIRVNQWDGMEEKSKIPPNTISLVESRIICIEMSRGFKQRLFSKSY